MKNVSDLTKNELISMLEKANETIKTLNEKIEKLSLLLAMDKARTFKTKQETIDKEEQTLFNYNETELNSDITLQQAISEKQDSKPRKAKSRNHVDIDFERFVTQTIIHDPKATQEGLFKDISEDIIYKAHVNVDIKVTKHIYKTVKNTTTGELLTETRDHAFNNSIATPSLVSYVANEKYLMGMPLYRQESAFLSTGFPLSRVDLSNFLMKGAAILYPFYEYLKHLLIFNEKRVLHADETTLKVIHVGDKKKKDKCYMWLYTTSMNDKPIYLYEYQYSRSGVWPREFLKDFKGYLVVDDYPGYNHIPNVTVQKCFAHARRKFFDIYKANKDPKIKEIIKMIDDIFELEKNFRKEKLDAKQIKDERNSVAYLSVLEAYFTHLESLNYSPTSVTGKAVLYSLKNKQGLTTFLSDGNIPLDNNLAERGIKPFVINRKNFLFSNTETGARASSMYMSIIQSAKACGLDTNKYLEYLFEHLYKINLYESDFEDQEILQEKFKQMEHLLPWNNEIKNQFKMKEASR